MSVARFSIIKTHGIGTQTAVPLTPEVARGSICQIVARGDFGAFDATTNPEGIQGLGASDKIIIAEVGDANSASLPVRRRTEGRLILKSVVLYADAALTLGTANNILLKIVRGTASVLPTVILKTITEASFAANTAVFATGIELLLESGDQIVLVPDGAMDGTAAATTDIYAEIILERLIEGGRVVQGTAVA